MSETLRDLTEDEILARYDASDDDAERGALLAEVDRRERKAKRTEIDRARWAAVYDSWVEFAHAQYLAAEEECRGNLVDRAYLSEVSDGWQLWTGSHRWAMTRATEELRDFWAVNPRITISEFREQQRAAAREERERAGR